MYLKQTTFLRYIYSVAAVLYLQSVLHVMLFPTLNTFCTFTSALPTVPNMAVFCSSLISPFPGTLLRYWVILRWFQSPLLLPVSLLYLQSTCAQCLPYSLYILGSSQLLSWSHFCPLNLQHLSPSNQHTLRCPVYCYRQFCPFALLIPQYGYRTFMTCFYQFRYMATLSNCAAIS